MSKRAEKHERTGGNNRGPNRRFGLVYSSKLVIQGHDNIDQLA